MGCSYCSHCKESDRRKTSREFWQWHLHFVRVGTWLNVTSQTSTDSEPFTEKIKADYVDDAHINGTTEKGVRIGLPTCYVLSVSIER